MDMRFEVGGGIEMRFDVGGSDPAPVSDGGTPFGSPVVTDKGFGQFFAPEYTPFGLVAEMEE